MEHSYGQLTASTMNKGEVVSDSAASQILQHLTTERCRGSLKSKVQ